MKTSNNSILITGGSAGIGFEFAMALSAGNKVIITGRNEARLAEAAARIPNSTAILGDVSDANDVERLVAAIYKDHPDLNIVINNAGKSAPVYRLDTAGAGAFTKAGEEMLVNYLSVVRLNEMLLPLLKRQASAAIVNVSSIVAIAPGGRLPSYSASKAALHSYTITLRQHLAKTNVRVFEIYPPLVNTGFSAEIGGATQGIPPSVVAGDLLKGLEEDRFDIRVGKTAELYQFYLASPEGAIDAMKAAEA
jgi:uncharacterized oxidoreductase